MLSSVLFLVAFVGALALGNLTPEAREDNNAGGSAQAYVVDVPELALADTLVEHVTASDSVGHGLTYAWSATGGSFDNAAVASPKWTAPANTTYRSSRGSLRIATSVAGSAVGWPIESRYCRFSLFIVPKKLVNIVAG